MSVGRLACSRSARPANDLAASLPAPVYFVAMARRFQVGGCLARMDSLRAALGSKSLRRRWPTAVYILRSLIPLPPFFPYYTVPWLAPRVDSLNECRMRSDTSQARDLREFRLFAACLDIPVDCTTAQRKAATFLSCISRARLSKTSRRRRHLARSTATTGLVFCQLRFRRKIAAAQPFLLACRHFKV